MSENGGKYGSKDYWNQEYEGGEFALPFEWLTSWEQLRDDLVDMIPNMTDRILIPGCGNAPFQLDMFDAGYEHMVCGDLSPIVINKMRAASKASGRVIQWDVMDATSMPYPDESFDVVIDKSLLDCLHCCERSLEVLRRYLDESYRVLAPGGRFIAVSLQNPQMMRSTVRGRAWILRQVGIYDSSETLADGNETSIGQGDQRPCPSVGCALYVCEKPVQLESSEHAVQADVCSVKRNKRKQQKRQQRLLQAAVAQVG